MIDNYIDNYIELGNSIAALAVKDLEMAILNKMLGGFSASYDKTIIECTEFIASDYFSDICKFNSNAVLNRIEQHTDTWKGINMELEELLSEIKKYRENLIPEAIDDVQRFLSIADVGAVKYDDNGSKPQSAENTAEIKNIDYTDAVEKLKNLKLKLGELWVKANVIIENIESDRARRFFKNYYLSGMSIRQMSKETGLTEKTIRNEISKAKVFLKGQTGIEKAIVTDT